MTIALALLSVELVGNRVERTYTVTASGSYANSGTTGDLANPNSATNPNNLARSKFSNVPDQFSVCNHPAGYVMIIHQGATFATFGLRFFQSDDAVDALDEISDGAYPAGITDSDGAPLQIKLSEKN